MGEQMPKKATSRSSKSSSKTKSRRRQPEEEEEGEIIDEQTYAPDPDKILEVRTPCSKEIKRIFDNLSHLLGECNLIFLPPEPGVESSEGMRISKPNADGDVMVKLSIPAANFSYYRCDADQIIAGIDTPEFYNKLKNIDEKDSIYIYMYRRNEDYLYIDCFRDEDRDVCTKKIEIKLMYVPDPDMPIESVTFESKISIPSAEFLKMCKNMSVSSDSLEIRSGGEMVSFCVRNENGSVSDNRYKYKGAGMCYYAGKFKMKNVLAIAKCNRLCNKVALYLLNGYPLVITIEIPMLGRLTGFLLREVDTVDD